MPNRVVFRDKGVVDFEAWDSPTIRDGAVRIRTTASLISTGTEGICLHRLFEPDTHWDHWVKYPFYPGYSLLGVITELGPGVESLAVGQRVVAKVPHASEAVVSATGVVPVPDGVSDEQAAWFALAKIGFQGWKAAQMSLGDDVLVVGAGPIGQMALRWMVAAGARSVVVLDPVEYRLELARQGGATATLATTVDQAGEPIRDLLRGKQPDLVIDTTGHAAVFAQCLPHVADFGKLILLGDTGRPSEQHLTLDVIRRGLRIIGAHDMHDTERWNIQSIVRFYFDLVERGRFSVDGLTSHTFSPDQAVAAYALLTERRSETMGVRFDW